MFKKSVAILLIALYTVTAAGFGLNIHYCFNRVSSVSFNDPAKNCILHNKARMSCCRDKHLDIKVKDAHQGQAAAYLAKMFTVEAPRLAFTEFGFSFKEQADVIEHYRGPPDGILTNKTIFIKNRVFRI